MNGEYKVNILLTLIGNTQGSYSPDEIIRLYNFIKSEYASGTVTPMKLVKEEDELKPH